MVVPEAVVHEDCNLAAWVVAIWMGFALLLVQAVVGPAVTVWHVLARLHQLGVAHVLPYMLCRVVSGTHLKLYLLSIRSAISEMTAFQFD